MNREAMMKAYAVLIGLVLILFGLFIYNKAFVGKNLSALGKVNNLLDAAAHPVDSDAPPAVAPAGASSAAAAVPTPIGPAAAGASAAPAAPPAVAQAASTDAPTPQANPADPSGLPAKGGLGSAMKNIRDQSEGQRKQLENSLNNPE